MLCLAHGDWILWIIHGFSSTFASGNILELISVICICFFSFAFVDGLMGCMVSSKMSVIFSKYGTLRGKNPIVPPLFLLTPHTATHPCSAL